MDENAIERDLLQFSLFFSFKTHIRYYAIGIGLCYWLISYEKLVNQNVLHILFSFSITFFVCIYGNFYDEMNVIDKRNVRLIRLLKQSYISNKNACSH